MCLYFPFSLPVVRVARGGGCYILANRGRKGEGLNCFGENEIVKVHPSKIWPGVVRREQLSIDCVQHEFEIHSHKFLLHSP